ncbi:hypothetical protein BJY01DRAFT_226241 [Aspergillus pseudoustus]|uniref:Uncharacterized protein n=1 Tax=Aspergillus pseudoustus TaxID=1810923 RepID=A0ABR4IVZ8_9EURO
MLEPIEACNIMFARTWAWSKRNHSRSVPSVSLVASGREHSVRLIPVSESCGPLLPATPS